MARSSLLRLHFIGIASTTLVAAAPPAADGGLADDYGYVELADMAFAAPLVVAADIATAVPLKPADAPDAPAGKTRYYVHADVRALVSGRADLPPQVSYLVDLPTDKKRKLKGISVLLLAAPSARPGELRLVGARAQVLRTPENEARLRSILTASVAPDAPPQVTGVQRAFHVPGSLPGESETQIFLRTADHRPISLNVLRRPGERPRWAVALTEMVDDSAAPPRPDSLLWYRLACGLPPRLPDGAVAGQSPEDADAARADYDVVLKGLGPCHHAG